MGGDEEMFAAFSRFSSRWVQTNCQSSEGFIESVEVEQRKSEVVFECESARLQLPSASA